MTIGRLATAVTSLVLGLGSGGAMAQNADGATARPQARPAPPGPLQAFGLETFAMPDCVPATPPVIGVVHLVLANNLDLTTRRVRSKMGVADPNSDAPGDTRRDGLANDPSNDVGSPFNIYMRQTAIVPSVGPPPSTGFLLIRIVIKKKSQWKFYNQGDIHGVGASHLLPGEPGVEAKDPGLLCGNRIKTVGNNTKQVATFYLDVAKYNQYWGNDDIRVPFNIIVFHEDAPDTPIIIDPKVRNDG